MAAIPNDSLVYYSSGQIKKLPAGDSVEITGAFTAGSLTAGTTGNGLVTAGDGAFSGNVNIIGNLTVKGKVTATDRVNVALGDAYVDLLASNTVTATAAAGGITVNIQAQTTAFDATAFTPGVNAGTQPYITVSNDPTGDFAADEIIQVSGTKNGTNDGLYVVASVSAAPNRIYVKGVGTTPVSTQTPFIQNDFTTSTGETTAKVVGAKVAVWTVSDGALYKAGPAAISAGTWAYHTGLTDTAFINNWSALTAVTVSLESAYVGGNTIQLTTGRDLIVYAPVSGSAAITLGANLASSITVTNDTFTLSASRIDLNTGNVNFAKAGTVSMNTSAATEAGNVVYRASGGGVGLSNAAGTGSALEVAGVVVGTPASGGYMAVVQGTTVLVKLTGAPANEGDIVYLSGTAGQGTVSIPGAGRIYRLGSVVSTAAVGGLYQVEWNPQYIIDLP